MPELVDYMKAGNPFLFIRTVEPDAAEEMVLAAAQSIPDLMKSGKFMVWKATKVIDNEVDNTKPARESRNSNIIASLEQIEKSTYDSPMVGVFHNIRQPLYNNNLLVQKFIDAILVAKKVGSHIICIGTDWEPPQELHNFVTFIDMPLPTKKDLMVHFSDTLKEWMTQAKEDGSELDVPKTVVEQEGLIEQAANAAVGMSMFNAESVIALSMVSKRTIDIPTISKQKAEEIRKSDVLTFIDVDDTIDSVGGFNVLKPWLAKRIKAFTPEAKEFGLDYPKGILLVGTSGTGKSLISKVIASTLKLPAINFDIGRVYRSLVGDSEATTRQALRTIEAVAPCVVILEEVEKGFAGISGSGTNDSGVTSRVVSTILTWRQETKFPVFFCMNANSVAGLPSMIYRRGRIDKVWATDLPMTWERKEIFKIHINKVGRDPLQFKLDLLAESSTDFTGAEIEGCISDALYMAFDDGKDLNTSYILQAIKETVPQAQRSVEEVTAIREWAKTRATMVSSEEAVEIPNNVQKRKVRLINRK